MSSYIQAYLQMINPIFICDHQQLNRAGIAHRAIQLSDVQEPQKFTNGLRLSIFNLKDPGQDFLALLVGEHRRKNRRMNCQDMLAGMEQLVTDLDLEIAKTFFCV